MKSYLAVLALSLVTGLVSAGEIKDPQNHLASISSYLGRPDFHADFRCGDKVSLSGGAKIAAIKVQSVELTQEVVCEGDQKILKTTMLSSEGALDNVQIAGEEIGSVFDNLDTADLILDQEAYETDPKEYLFEMLNYMGENDSVLIKSVKFDRMRGPGDVKINAMIIQAEVMVDEIQAPGMFKKMNVKVYVSKDLPGVSRIFKTEITTGKVLIMSAAGAKLEVTSVSR